MLITAQDNTRGSYLEFGVFTGSSFNFAMKVNKKIEKIFPFLKICYFKKIIHINHKSFDMLTNSKLNLSEEKIVFIDSGFDHGDRTAIEGKPSERLWLEYFDQLNQLKNK